MRRATRLSTRLSGRLNVTVGARRFLHQLHRDAGDQVLLLSWPGGVTCLPASVYDPGPYNVIVGHVARCAVYTDLRQLAIYRDSTVLVDTSESTINTGSPILRTVVSARR